MKRITSKSVRQGMHLPPQLENAYERVVVAGMKVLFSKQTRSTVMQQLQQPGSTADKLGDGIAGLVLMLYQQSNKTMPPQVIIPAGIELVVHAAEFLEKAGIDVSEADVADGTAKMIGIVLKTFKINPDKVMAMTSQFQQASGIPPQQGVRT